MAEGVYLLCAIASVLCAFMLFKGYLKGRSQLLLWSSLCFGFLAANNVMLFVDLVLIPDVEFGGIMWRNLLGATAGSLLLFGLIWELT
jgi:hypothetical protein